MAQLGPFLGSAISTVTEGYERRMNDKERQLQRAMATVAAREAELAAALVELEAGRAAAGQPPMLAPVECGSDPEPAGRVQQRPGLNPMAHGTRSRSTCLRLELGPQWRCRPAEGLMTLHVTLLCPAGCAASCRQVPFCLASGTLLRGGYICAP